MALVFHSILMIYNILEVASLKLISYVHIYVRVYLESLLMPLRLNLHASLLLDQK